MSLPARVDRIGSVDVAELLTLEQEASDLDAIWVFSALRRRWIFVLLGPVVFALAGGLLAARQDKVYEAAALVSLESSAADRAFGSNTTGTADREIQTEVQYLNSVAFRLLFGTTLARSTDFRAQIVFNTSAVELVGRAATAGRAAETANAAGDLYVSQRRQRVVDDLARAQRAITDKLTEAQTRLDGLNARIAAQPAVAGADSGLVAQRTSLATEVGSLRDTQTTLDLQSALTSGGSRVIARALPPTAPILPRSARSAFLAGLLGVLAGVLAAIVVERRSDDLRASDEVVRRLNGVPMLATVPALNMPHRGVLLLGLPHSPPAEAIRSLRTSVQFVGLDRPLRRIQVTSATEDEGATAVAANLAVAFAGAGLRVVIVDGDLRTPKLHEYLGVDGGRGFTTVLVGQAELEAALQPIAMQGWLRVLAAGPRPTNPSDLLASGRLARLLDVLEEGCDLVIIDSPPVLPYTDAAITSNFVDTTIVVASGRESKMKSVNQALRTLRIVGAHVAGLVVSDLEPQQRSGPRRLPTEADFPSP